MSTLREKIEKAKRNAVFVAAFAGAPTDSVAQGFRLEPVDHVPTAENVQTQPRSQSGRTITFEEAQRQQVQASNPIDASIQKFENQYGPLTPEAKRYLHTTQQVIDIEDFTDASGIVHVNLTAGLNQEGGNNNNKAGYAFACHPINNNNLIRFVPCNPSLDQPSKEYTREKAEELRASQKKPYQVAQARRAPTTHDRTTVNLPGGNRQTTTVYSDGTSSSQTVIGGGIYKETRNRNGSRNRTYDLRKAQQRVNRINKAARRDGIGGVIREITR